MNAGLVIVSCIGALMVIFNRPLGRAMHHAGLAMGERDYGVWAYRVPVVGLGVLLTCLSFLVYYE